MAVAVKVAATVAVNIAVNTCVTMTIPTASTAGVAADIAVDMAAPAAVISGAPVTANESGRRGGFRFSTVGRGSRGPGSEWDRPASEAPFPRRQRDLRTVAGHRSSKVGVDSGAGIGAGIGEDVGGLGGVRGGASWALDTDLLALPGAAASTTGGMRAGTPGHRRVRGQSGARGLVTFEAATASPGTKQTLVLQTPIVTNRVVGSGRGVGGWARWLLTASLGNGIHAALPALDRVEGSFRSLAGLLRKKNRMKEAAEAPLSRNTSRVFRMCENRSEPKVWLHRFHGALLLRRVLFPTPLNNVYQN
jgi:hypothetical protein